MQENGLAYGITQKAFMDLCQRGRLLGASNARIGDYVVVYVNCYAGQPTHYVRTLCVCADEFTAAAAVKKDFFEQQQIKRALRGTNSGNRQRIVEVWHIIADSDDLYFRVCARDDDNDFEDFRASFGSYQKALAFAHKLEGIYGYVAITLYKRNSGHDTYGNTWDTWLCNPYVYKSDAYRAAEIKQAILDLRAAGSEVDF